MQIIIRKESDGQYYTAYCENLPGCYVQSTRQEDLGPLVKKAIALLKKSYVDRNQPLPEGKDHPLFNIRIRFNELSTGQLIKIFERYNYHLQYEDSSSVLLMNSEFPFNRIHLPVSQRISPLLIRRIFGKENTIYMGSNQAMRLNTSATM